MVEELKVGKKYLVKLQGEFSNGFESGIFKLCLIEETKECFKVTEDYKFDDSFNHVKKYLLKKDMFKRYLFIEEL